MGDENENTVDESSNLKRDRKSEQKAEMNLLLGWSSRSLKSEFTLEFRDR